MHINKNTYDLRDEYSKCRALSIVFDQGACPACFPFALASTLGTKICMAYGKETMIPSPYRIYDCAGKDCRNSESGLNAMHIIKVLQNGVPDISETPSVFGWGCQLGSIKSKQFRDICGISRIKNEISLYGPVIVVVDFDEAKKNLLREFGEWDDLDLRNAENTLNKHSVMAIGWADTHWIVKNSWGMNWGINGTGRVPWTMSDCALTFSVLIEPLAL